MKKLMMIILVGLSISAFAVDYEQLASQTVPSATMQSVNNTSYMTSGSALSTNVYEVGAYSVQAPSPACAPRKAPPGGTGTVSDYDPANPKFSPIGDPVLPLLLFAITYVLIKTFRRKNEA